MFTIRDGNGQELATALADTSASTGEMVIQRVVRGKGHLLHHYFGRGLRAVLIDSGESQLHGVLSTRWLGAERQWIVRLGQSAALRPAISNQPEDSSHVIQGRPAPCVKPERSTQQQRAKETAQ